MKADAVARIVREAMKPLAKEHGLKRTGALGWHAPIPGGEHFVLWFQLSRDGWDTYAGNKMVLELARSPTPTIGCGERARLARFLHDADRALATRMTNDVIAKLVKPPPTHPILAMEARVAHWYLAKFEPMTADFAPRDDLWLRYHDAQDVRRWADFAIARIPRAMEELTPELLGGEARPTSVLRRPRSHEEFRAVVESAAAALGGHIEAPTVRREAPELDAAKDPTRVR